MVTIPDGIVESIAGPVVKARNMKGAKMYDVVRIGDLGLIGEIIGLDGEIAVIQVYEETSGLMPGEKVVRTEQPLSVALGPGLIGMIYDGIQRPLDKIKLAKGDYIPRGVQVDPLEMQKQWPFKPLVKEGAVVHPGDFLGHVQRARPSPTR